MFSGTPERSLIGGAPQKTPKGTISTSKLLERGFKYKLYVGLRILEGFEEKSSFQP